ncbi:class I SAM-dependent methyltransferase [Candidatus Poribacteria bacterium]|nr:class I SAM-dependent methyltransferase [Candidatus Poribacteria bacterium]
MNKIKYTEVKLYKLPVLPPVALVKAEFQKIHPGAGLGLMRESDYRRLSYVYSCIKHFGSVLDIGVASGQFMNILAMSGKFKRVCGIDIEQHSKYARFTDSYEIHTAGVDNMPFGEKEFDVVTCMEVLEHLDSDTFQKALGEIRRICRLQLIVTVPLNEDPLPPYHRLRFTEEDVARYFPHAGYRLLIRHPPRRLSWLLNRPPLMSWLLIEENYA